MMLVNIEPFSGISEVTFQAKGEETWVLAGEVFSDHLLTLPPESSVILKGVDGMVEIWQNQNRIGAWTQLKFLANDAIPQFRLFFPKGKVLTQSFPDHLVIKAEPTGLQLYNLVWLENYVAGVIAGEVGHSTEPEFLKVQAVCSRTYAFKNQTKHASEGFDACDKTHCQAYKGITPHHSRYLNAAKSTLDEVIVFKQDQLIDAVFYANCGGITANSEEVWSNEIGYLRSVSCSPFCLNTVNSIWKKTIPKAKVLQSFSNYYNHKITRYKLEKGQSGRVRKILLNNGEFSLNGEVVRKLLGLKSSLYSVSEVGSNLLFFGRGFGHGVGMCQDGAAARAKKGWKYDKIIKYYYKNVETMPYYKLAKE